MWLGNKGPSLKYTILFVRGAPAQGTNYEPHKEPSPARDEFLMLKNWAKRPPFPGCSADTSCVACSVRSSH